MSPAVFRESVNHGGHEGLTCLLAVHLGDESVAPKITVAPKNKRTLWIFLNWDLRLRN